MDIIKNNQKSILVMKTIAIPVSNNKLDAHFGHCEELYLYEIENEKIINEIRLSAPPHEPGLLPKWLGWHNVTDVIAGGMGQRAIRLFNDNNINVFIGAPSKPPKEIVENLFNGSLELSGNYCNH